MINILNYVELENFFPGYEFKKIWNDKTQSKNRDIDLGFGGVCRAWYVWKCSIIRC